MGDGTVFRQVEPYRPWALPNQTPFPYLGKMSHESVGGVNWDEVVEAHTPLNHTRRLKRTLWRMFTLNGLVVSGTNFITDIWKGATAFTLAGLWGTWLTRHFLPLFSSDYALVGNAGQEFAANLVVSILACYIPQIYNKGVRIYMRRQPRKRRVNRDAFLGFEAEIMRHDPAYESYAMDYNSDDEPASAIKFYCAEETLMDERGVICDIEASCHSMMDYYLLQDKTFVHYVLVQQCIGQYTQEAGAVVYSEKQLRDVARFFARLSRIPAALFASFIVLAEIKSNPLHAPPDAPPEWFPPAAEEIPTATVVEEEEWVPASARGLPAKHKKKFVHYT